MAFLILADGSVFPGISVGIQGQAVGEIVFNTAATGYQEILTDPSYFGQIITFTTAHVGNVGINDMDFESPKVHANGVILRDFCVESSHWRAQDTLGDYFKRQQLVVLSDIDTRALTLHLRDHGSQIGVLVTDRAVSIDSARHIAQQHRMPKDPVKTLSIKIPFVFADPMHAKAHIVVVDCGVKAGILRALTQAPVKVSVVPSSTSFAEIMAMGADGVLLSNGPGDPEQCSDVIELTSHLLKHAVPLFGICLGHQIMALAAGAKTKKMKFGHHGANHPIQCCNTKSVFISSQNHSFVVDEATLPACLRVTHKSLFDGTIAGLAHQHSPAFSFQGHPEANPGPHELSVLFNQFLVEVYHAKKHRN